jgi:hypothetical protein
MTDTNNSSQAAPDLTALRDFIDCSTLGTPGARALSSRTPQDQVDHVLRLARLPVTATDSPALPPLDRAAGKKILVAGGFGAGKTTLVGSVSEITPLTTEAIMTDASVGVDDIGQIPGKVTTTVCMDYGRMTLDADLTLNLFGTPGQYRFWFMWDDLIRSAIAAVLVVDTRRLADCFPAVDYFEQQRLPFIVAINCFDGVQHHSVDDVRAALAVSPDVPILSCDARSRGPARQVLVSLMDHVRALRRHATPGESDDERLVVAPR